MSSKSSDSMGGQSIPKEAPVRQSSDPISECSDDLDILYARTAGGYGHSTPPQGASPHLALSYGDASDRAELDHAIACLIARHGRDAVEDSIHRCTSFSERGSSVKYGRQLSSSTTGSRAHFRRFSQEEFSLETDYWARTFQRDDSSGERSLSSAAFTDDPDAPSAFGSIRARIKNKAKKMVRKSRNLLRTSERIRRGVVEASFDPIFCINEKGSILMANRASEKVFGWPKEEMVGQNISIVVGGDHPVSHNEYIEQYLTTGDARVVGKRREWLARRRDGLEFPIELAVTEIKMQGPDQRLFFGFIRDLTRQKHDEQELKRKHEVTLGVIDSAFDPMFTTDYMGIISIANQAAVEKFGWNREQLVGQSLSIVLGGNENEDPNGYFQCFLKKGLQCEKGKVARERREMLGRKKDGTEFPIELGFTEVVHSGQECMYCAFVRDLTRQKHDEQELKRKHEITMGIIEASFDAMFAIDENGIIRMVNHAAQEQLGWSRDEFMGQNISMIIAGDHALKHDEYIHRYIETGIKKMIGTQREVEGRKKDGSTFPLMLGLSEIDRTGSSPLFVGFVRDLTDEKELMEMEIEKVRAEGLLLNMLPEDIAFRLKDDPSHIADHYTNTTILFADIVGFTRLSSLMSPVELVRLLNDLFSRFDEILDRYELNKVKTIGDCYMVTSVPDTEHQQKGCVDVCHFALDMLDELQRFNVDHHGQDLNLRVGVNSGSVVAGVVGTKRFMYDLWGDAVNLASRMESTGIPGKIQVTKDVVNLLPRSEFDFESRGMIHIKGRGDMETFLLLKRNRAPVISEKPPEQRKPRSRLFRRSSAPPEFAESMRDLKLEQQY